MTLKLSRLVQPRNPRFWLLVVLNGLSSAIAFVLRTHELPTAVTLALAGFAVANVVLGLRIAFQLMTDERPLRSTGLPE